MHTKGHSGVRDIRHGETRGIPQGGHIQGYPRASARGRGTQINGVWETEKREWVGGSRI